MRNAGGDLRSADEGTGRPQEVVHGPVRPLVAKSWQRSLERGVDPCSSGAPVALNVDELAEARSDARWSTALPVMRALLTQAAVDSGHVVAVGDAHGRLLWIDGAPQMRRRADRMGFTEGALWSEDAVGTNAPGTALALDQAVQISTDEHFLGVAQPWSCTAVPLHDPASGDVMGVIDVTGHDHVVSPIALAMVRATAVAVEASLAAAPRHSAPSHRLKVLGRDRALLIRRGQTVRLSARHSELLLLLSLSPGGLSGEALAAQLSDEEVSPVTLRAELTRLRRVIGADLISSRPYRLTEEVCTDAAEVMAAVDRGDVASAIRAYTGPVLPLSESPVIRDLRGQLRSRMRRAALVGTSADTLLAFAATEDGRDDIEVLHAALRLLPPRSPRRLGVAARIDRANATHGFPGPRRGTRPRTMA